MRIDPKKLKLLDLYCGAGGAARGYHNAGFSEIVGVDIRPQPRYPFEFIQGDVMGLDYEFLDQFDFIHASPPCQEYSKAAAVARKRGKVYPDLLSPTRRMLEAAHKPWVIENVPGAPMWPDICLCGSMFDLRVIRHRYFETNIRNLASQFRSYECRHSGTVRDGDYMPVYGRSGRKGSLIEWQNAMAIDWMSRDELREAIPPAYTHAIGLEALLILHQPGSHLRNRRNPRGIETRLVAAAHQVWYQRRLL
jgi:DNA (cytosine-5)-methyltransferase 1